MKCLICENDVSADSYGVAGQIHPCVHGTTFEATGNYGSAHFDPLDNGEQFLQIAICNDCFATKTRVIEHVRFKRQHPVLDRRQTFEDFNASTNS